MTGAITQKKLFLLDAFALIYRSYFAFSKNPRINSKGQNTSAAFGFTNTLHDVISKEKPTHIAVVFDAPGGSFRNEDFTEYKAHREEMPEDIRSMLDEIKEIIKGFNIPTYSLSGYEADDIIGTIAKGAEKEGYTVFMMTPDKDFAQLVSDNIFMYKPARGGKAPEVIGIPEVQQIFEIEKPEQVIDILGLWGDAADNIPGIPGIGEKTSKKLIHKYGSIENLIANTNDLKGKQKENVINFGEQGLLSKKLATIVTDAPIEYNIDACKLEPYNKEALIESFTRLEFRNISRRILGEEIKVIKNESDNGDQLDLFNISSTDEEPSIPNEFKTIETEEHHYILVNTPEKLKELVSVLEKCSAFCFDTETSSLDTLTTKLVGLSFSIKANEAYWVPLKGSVDEIKDQISCFKPIFNQPEKTAIAHNFKFDYKVLLRYGIDINNKIFDTMIAHYLLNTDMKHNMDILAETYLHYKPISIESIIGKKGKNQKSMIDIPAEELIDYAAEDADITFQLYEYFKPLIIKNGFKDLFETIEIPLIKALASMENEGINLDTEALAIFSKELEDKLTELTKNIFSFANEEFNIDSPKQLGVVLFEELAIDPKAKKTKTGQYKTGEDVLNKLINKHEIIPLILEYRQLKKLKSTYVDALPELIQPKTGRIHTSFMQTVAATGRLSSTNPNLQNIPIRTENGKEIRKAFIARNKDFKLLSADYSQIELRIIAALSKDPNMVEAFSNNFDIHAATAAKVFGIDISEVTRDQRSSAKAVNFGIIYGQSAFGLSQKLNIKRSEAKAIIDSYYNQYSSIKEYMNSQIEFARKHGYTETLFGRKRYLSDINSVNAIVRGFAERNAVNSPIQGTAADIIKIAMNKIQKKLIAGNYQSKMILQVHDELIFDVHHTEEKEIKELVINEMQNAVDIGVPLDVEGSIATNWLEAH